MASVAWDTLFGLLEENGVKLLLLETRRDSFFGLSVGARDDGPAVVVNTWDRISVERWIFTAAHELGHLLLHPDEYRRDVMELPVQTEREADVFAREFLMTETAFDSEWEETRGHSLLVRVLKVKRIFRVSYKTVLYRLVESGRETSDVWRAFQGQHRGHFGKTLRKTDEPDALGASEFAWNWSRSGEPAGLNQHDFIEDRLSRLVRQALERGRISLGRAAEILGITRQEAMRKQAREWASYGNVAALLKRVEGCRNRFVHGEPEAIDDSLVEALVAGLKDKHEGWIAVFNRRLKETRKGSSLLHG